MHFSAKKHKIDFTCDTFCAGQHCEANTTSDFKGTFYWNSTFSADLLNVLCPVQSEDNGTHSYEFATRYCNNSLGGAVGVWNWSEPDTSRCQFASAITRELQNLSMASLMYTRYFFY